MVMVVSTKAVRVSMVVFMITPVLPRLARGAHNDSGKVSISQPSISST